MVYFNHGKDSYPKKKRLYLSVPKSSLTIRFFHLLLLLRFAVIRSEVVLEPFNHFAKMGLMSKKKSKPLSALRCSLSEL